MSVETKPIWFTTGNPFVDTGQEVMAALAGIERSEDLSAEEVRSLIPDLVKLYMREGWRKNLYTIFPNSKLTNGSVKRPKEEYQGLLEYWSNLLISGESPVVTEGTPCAISGTRANVYIGKMFLPMSDYGSSNFQSGNSEGVPVSASVALALQFYPLALIKIGKMMALPHFSNAEAQAKWADRMVDSVNFDETVGIGGVGDVGTSRPVNAFFRLVERLVRDQTDFPTSSVTLYLFNNFNQVDYTSATEIHYMPSRIFSFIQAAMSPSAGDSWRKIVWRGYPANRKVEDEEDALRPRRATRSLELTYEDLKHEGVASAIENQLVRKSGQFGAYLRGFETSVKIGQSSGIRGSLELTYENLKLEGAHGDHDLVLLVRRLPTRI